MDHNEHDEVWDLLGKAPERKASPFFANKVMHAIHREPERITFRAWLRRWWWTPVAAGACAAVAVFAILKDSAPPQAPASALAKTEAPAPADPLAEMVVVIADTDEFEATLSDLVATEDHSVWLAADPSSLF